MSPAAQLAAFGHFRGTWYSVHCCCYVINMLSCTFSSHLSILTPHTVIAMMGLARVSKASFIWVEQECKLSEALV